MKISKSKLAKLARITITCEQDPETVRGNALASGHDAEDRSAEDAIIARLDADDVWAWCVVTVTAEYDGVTGSDVLGACSYASESAFKRGGYYGEMKRAALAELHSKLAAQCGGGTPVKPRWTREAGNVLALDGIPATSLHLERDAHHNAPISPSQHDDIAEDVCAYLNAREAYKRTKVRR